MTLGSMNIKDIILSTKSAVNTGEWRRGEIPRAKWPSRRAKAKAYKYGPLYQWRIVTFWAGGYDCRVRLLFNGGKQIFRASLGIMISGETVVLCEYEFHASEPGWHCHVRCGEIEGVHTAYNRFGSARIPEAKSYHRRMAFQARKQPLTAQTAFNLAVSTFRIDKDGGGL